MYEEIMDIIDLYLGACGNSGVASHRLDEEELNALGKIKIMLSALKEATKSWGGSIVSLTKGLVAIDFILTKFEDRRVQDKNYTVMPRLTGLAGRKRTSITIS